MICLFNEDGGWSVWTNPDGDDSKSGRCIGYAETLPDALKDALTEIKSDEAEVLALMCNQGGAR